MRPGQYIVWHDLFAIVDDGATPVPRYDLIESAMRENAKMFPQGIACVVILPPGTQVPPDDARQRVKDLLARLGPSLSCLTYVIEGSGFKAAAARATLISMKVFASRPYPIYVETSIKEGLAKVLPHLIKGKTVTTDVKVIMKAIGEARKAWTDPSAGPDRMSP
jgi:hypothetical protein